MANTLRLDGVEYEIGSPAYDHVVDPIIRTHSQRLQAWESLNPKVRTDSNATAFLARELVHIRGEMERTVYEDLRAPEFVPVDTNFPRGAQSYAVTRGDTVGRAKVTHDLAGDSPRTDVKRTEDLAKFVNVRASHGYSVQDLDYAAMSGAPLPRWKAMATAEVIARGADAVCRHGTKVENDAIEATDADLTGFFNNANVGLVTPTNNDWLDGATTPAEILADLAQIEQAVIAGTKDTQSDGYSLVLPSNFEGILRSTPRSIHSDVSIAEWFLKNARIIRSIERWVALDDATGAATGASGARQGIVYRRDPRNLYWPISVPYEELAPQASGWEWVVEARTRCGGVDVRRPYAMKYVNLTIPA